MKILGRGVEHMTKLDYFWMTNEDWYHITDTCDFVLNDDAPEEAKKSYQNYLKELKEASERGSL